MRIFAGPKLLHQQLIHPIAVLKSVGHSDERQCIFGEDGIFVCCCRQKQVKFISRANNKTKRPSFELRAAFVR